MTYVLKLAPTLQCTKDFRGEHSNSVIFRVLHRVAINMVKYAFCITSRRQNERNLSLVDSDVTSEVGIHPR